MTMLLPSITEVAEANSRYQRRVHGIAINRREEANRPWNILEQDAPTVRREADARLARFLRDNPRKSN